MGDFEQKKNYKDLLKDANKKQKLRANVLMIPHHGSDSEGNGENEDFYKEVKAEYGVISSYVASVHRHPKIKPLENFCRGAGVSRCNIG